MKLKKSKSVFRWREPFSFILLKRQIENREKSILNNYGTDIIIFIIFFVMAFIIRLSVINQNLSIIYLLKEFIIISSTSLFITIVLSFSSDLGYSRIEIYEDHISAYPRKPDYLSYRMISKIIVENGIYKNKKYNLLKIYNHNKLLRVIFLSNKISIEEVIKFLNEREIKLIYEKVDNI